MRGGGTRAWHLARRCEGAVDVEEREDARIPPRGGVGGGHREPWSAPHAPASATTSTSSRGGSDVGPRGRVVVAIAATAPWSR